LACIGALEGTSRCRIATALSQRYGLTFEGDDPETFLERLSL
jgi:hypothetical protein